MTHCLAVMTVDFKASWQLLLPVECIEVYVDASWTQVFSWIPIEARTTLIFLLGSSHFIREFRFLQSSDGKGLTPTSLLGIRNFNFSQMEVFCWIESFWCSSCCCCVNSRSVQPQKSLFSKKIYNLALYLMFENLIQLLVLLGINVKQKSVSTCPKIIFKHCTKSNSGFMFYFQKWSITNATRGYWLAWRGRKNYWGGD